MEISNQVRVLCASKIFVLIGVDGCGGSGKSTFARELSEALKPAPIIPFDDFYKPAHERMQGKKPHEIGWQFDWRRLETEVLAPLESNGYAHYRKYDWNTDSLAEIRTVRAESPIIIEGVYTLRPELLPYYDLRLWIECPKEIRLRRGIERDGEQARSQWENDWMREEERYVLSCNPHQRAERIILGIPAAGKK